MKNELLRLKGSYLLEGDANEESGDIDVDEDFSAIRKV